MTLMEQNANDRTARLIKTNNFGSIQEHESNSEMMDDRTDKNGLDTNI